LALVAFGGAGPLHACALAEMLGMPAVVVPPRAGVLSAVGLLGAPRQVDLVRSWADPADHAGAAAAATALVAQAGDGAGAEVSFDCRYAGQSHELTVASVDRFAAEHAQRNGFTLDLAVEVVAIRASARWPSPVDINALSVPDRRGPVRGPAVIAEADCTIWVAPGWRAVADPAGSWLITRAG
jgi:N-methylhydantoinase A/oxoprolinase/acetone carboxylase beta subunit